MCPNRVPFKGSCKGSFKGSTRVQGIRAHLHETNNRPVKDTRTLRVVLTSENLETLLARATEIQATTFEDLTAHIYIYADADTNL